MPQWIDDKTKWEFRVSNASQDTSVSVTGVMDASDVTNERPKIILADHPDNQAASVLKSPAREECINSLSESMKAKNGIEREDIDWFIQDSDGKIQSLSLKITNEKATNPEYERLVQNHEFADHIEAKNAKKNFPDIDVEKLEATPHDLSSEQQEKLNTAFNEARINRNMFQSVQQEQEAVLSNDLPDKSFSR